MPRPATATHGPAAFFVEQLEQAVKGGSSVGNCFTETGARSLLAALRAGTRYAAPIALAGDRLNVGDGLVGLAADAMAKASARVNPNRADEDEENERTNVAESYYLLGLLVGLEIACGIKGGVR